MANFKTFLVEEQIAQIDLFSIAEPALKYFNDKQVTAIKNAITEFEQIVNAPGPIYNPDYQAFKETINWLFPKVYYSTYYRQAGSSNWYAHDSEFDKYDADPNLGIQSIKKIMTSCTQLVAAGEGSVYEPIFTELLVLATAYKGLLDVHKSLKERVVSGRKPKEVKADAKGNFVGKLGSQPAIDKVTEALKAQFTPLLDQYEAETVKHYMHAFERVAAIVGSKDKVSAELLVGEDAYLFSRGFEFKVATNYKRGEHHTYYAIKALPFKPLAEKFAAQERSDIEAAFMAKNIRKLSNIVDKKGLTVTITPIGESVIRRSAIEASLKFVFPDSSSFIVLNKVIINSRYDRNEPKSFYQYPTTFHDVVLADGTKMKFPSEEKMISTFL